MKSVQDGKRGKGVKEEGRKESKNGGKVEEREKYYLQKVNYLQIFVLFLFYLVKCKVIGKVKIFVILSWD